MEGKEAETLSETMKERTLTALYLPLVNRCFSTEPTSQGCLWEENEGENFELGMVF